MTLPTGWSVEQLLAAAREAARQAYVPYSDFPVGAALLADDGTLITGCNVENASYGLTLCAERTALVKAVSEGHRCFTAIAVWGERCEQGAITPCGACRQALAEFLAPDTPVVLANETITLGALLPRTFGLASGESRSQS